MAEKYPHLSSFSYVGNNPINAVDPDGKQIIGTDGRPVTYHKSEDGSFTWSKNASADVVKVGTLMLRSDVGTNQLNKMINAKHDIKIKISDKENRRTNPNPGNKIYKLGETVNSSLRDENGEKYLVESEITIFEGTIKKYRELNSNSEKQNLYKEATIENAIGAVATHESFHATDKENLSQAGQEREIEPNKLEINHLKSVNTPKKIEPIKPEGL